jgi:sec-independent protein translocase protein TatB
VFDVGFWELAVIMIVALLVIGPERLPRVARAEELKTMLTKQAEAPELKQFRDELTRDIDSPSPPDTATTPQAVEKKPDATPPASDDERS